MKFLEKYGFSNEDIDEFINNTPKMVLEGIKEYQHLVEENLAFIESLGAKTYKEIFIHYTDMFFMDPSTFKSVFNRYQKDSLIERLNENYKVVEYL